MVAETPRISATDEALDAIARLTAKHGRLMLFQSGGCCDGSAPLCLPDGELLIGTDDLLLGRSPLDTVSDRSLNSGLPATRSKASTESTSSRGRRRHDPAHTALRRLPV